MAQPHTSEAPFSSSSPFSSVRANRDTSGASTSYTTTSQVSEEENESNHPQFLSPELESQHLNISYQGGVNWGSIDVTSILRDDTWSCVIVIFVFWFFVSMTMILGVYGSMNLVLGPNSSILLHPSSVFVQSIKVENSNKSMSGAMLYGMYGSPSLDIVSTWTETHNVFMPSNSHKEWIYYLNEGSQVNISYRLNSQSSSIFLAIAEGNEGLTQWLEDPTYPNTTLSWSIIHGGGMISQQIFRSSSYYVAVGNLNEKVEHKKATSSIDDELTIWPLRPKFPDSSSYEHRFATESHLKVELNLRVMAFLYNTTNAYYKCDLSSNPCSLSVFFPGENAAVLTSPGPEQNTSNDEWHVKLSYGPRWVTYIFGTGVMTLIMFLAFNFLPKLHCIREDRPATEHEGTASQRAPLLSYKDDDLSSWGSSYDSMSQDEEDLNFTGVSIDGKSLGDGETNNNTQRLCAICFDAPRDCFFLPCGHCVACFACGARIVEAAGTCPVCHRNMKKVRKIFTV